MSRVRPMTRVKSGLVTCWVLAGALFWPGAVRGASGPGAEATVEVVLEALRLGVASDRPVYTRARLLEIGRQLGIEPEAAKRQIGAALDSLEAHAERESELWQELVAAGRGHPGPRGAGRLLRELIRQGRRVTQGDDQYILQTAVAYAARKAGVPWADARAYVERIAASRATAGDGTTSEPVGIVVAGRSMPYTRSMDKLFLYFGTRDEATVNEALREVHRFVVPRVVAQLPKSPQVKWAVRERDLTPLLSPDLHVTVQVDQLRFVGRSGGLVPCMDLELELRTDPEAAPSRTLPLAVCEEGAPVSTGDLTQLYAEAAEAACAAISDLLDAGWRGR